jgi:ABC-type phosphate transport system substrate-binding protein
VKRWFKAVATFASVAAIGIGLVAAPAGAAVPNPGYGWETSPAFGHLIVGAGSDTTYRVMTSLSDLYAGSGGCLVDLSSSTANTCLADASQGDATLLGNWQHDTVAEAYPSGSSAGINALNGTGSYDGTVGGTPSFARSSRSNNNAAELAADTFWGFAEDGIEVVVFNTRGTAGALTTPAPDPNGTVAAHTLKLTWATLDKIWTCQYTTWSQIPELGITVNGPEDGPIVPWSMNSKSGTQATFTKDVANASGDAGFATNTNPCDRVLANGSNPFENDIKPLFNDANANPDIRQGGPTGTPAGLSNVATSTQNPVNWIWWGSFGELSTFTFKYKYTIGGNTYQAYPAPVQGFLPSTTNVGDGSYPLARELYTVTKWQDADCPRTGVSPNATCDSSQYANGPNLPTAGKDINVAGAQGGTSGAVREFVRFICRSSTAQFGLDPYTGKNYLSEINGALTASGFTTIPVASRQIGRCDFLANATH